MLLVSAHGTGRVCGSDVSGQVHMVAGAHGADPSPGLGARHDQHVRWQLRWPTPPHQRASRAPVRSGGASASGTCAQATEEVDATDNGSNYEEDLHWEPLSAPEGPSVMAGFGVSPDATPEPTNMQSVSGIGVQFSPNRNLGHLTRTCPCHRPAGSDVVVLQKRPSLTWAAGLPAGRHVTFMSQRSPGVVAGRLVEYRECSRDYRRHASLSPT